MLNLLIHWMVLNLNDGFTLWGPVCALDLHIRSERRLKLNLHSAVLRDEATLWVESVFILDRNEGLVGVLAISFCAGTFWDDWHSVPVTFLYLPFVAWFCMVGLFLFDSVPCFTVPSLCCTRDDWIVCGDSYE